MHYRTVSSALKKDSLHGFALSPWCNLLLVIVDTFCDLFSIVNYIVAHTTWDHNSSWDPGHHHHSLTTTLSHPPWAWRKTASSLEWWSMAWLLTYITADIYVLWWQKVDCAKLEMLVGKMTKECRIRVFPCWMGFSMIFYVEPGRGSTGLKMHFWVDQMSEFTTAPIGCGKRSYLHPWSWEGQFLLSGC